MRKAPRLACGSQRTMCRNWFSPSTKWILGMELRSSVSGESRYLLNSVSGLVSRLLQLGLDLSGHSVNAGAHQAEAKTDSSYCRWREGTGTLCVRILRWKQLWQDLWEIFLGIQLPILRGLLPEEARGFTEPREQGELGLEK